MTAQRRGVAAEGTDWWRQRVHRLACGLLVMFLAGICSRGYGYYGQTLKTSPGIWLDVVRGTAQAPDQYRVGVVLAANWICVHTGQRISRVFGAFDVAGAIFAALLLYRLLVCSRSYQRSRIAVQSFGSALFVALVVYLVDWVNWYQKVSTLPSAALVAAMVWVWTPRAGAAGRSAWWRGALFLALVAAQGLVRADVALAVCLGVLVASAAGWSPELCLHRDWAMAISALGGLIAGGTQLYLMKVRYPLANYGGVPVLMLAHDWRRAAQWMFVLIFAAPFLWTLLQVLRHRPGSAAAAEAAHAAFLAAGVVYLALWLVLGRLAEVRIFLPVALAVCPLTVMVAMQQVEAVSGAMRE